MAKSYSVHLMGAANKKVNKNFFKLFCATFISFAPLFIVSLLPYGVGLAISLFLIGTVITGYIRFMKLLFQGENPQYSILYSEFKSPILQTLTGILLSIMYLVGGVLFIVPAVYFLGKYSMVLFIQEEHEQFDIKSTFKKASDLMEGNKVHMFGYKVFFYLFYTLTLGAGLFSYIGISVLSETKIGLSIGLAILAILVFISVLSVITMYFTASNIEFYNELKSHYVPSVETKQTEKVETAETVEPKEQQPVEEKVEQPKKVAKPKTTTTKKTTTTTKKPAAKTTTAKKSTTKKVEQK